jgi:predicted CopG family antitoxin
MKRMNVTLDEEALEHARQLTGKKSFSDTINYAITEFVKQIELARAIEDLANDDNAWWPGYVEEMAPDVAAYLKKNQKEKRRRTTAANIVRAPKEKRAKRSGSR